LTVVIHGMQRFCLFSLVNKDVNEYSCSLCSSPIIGNLLRFFTSHRDLHRCSRKKDSANSPSSAKISAQTVHPALALRSLYSVRVQEISYKIHADIFAKLDTDATAAGDYNLIECRNIGFF